MNKLELQQVVTQLKLPKGEYVIFGAASLTIRELRDCSDLDLFVTHTLYEKLLSRGWRETSDGNKQPYLVAEHNTVPMQAFEVWEGGDWQPNIQIYLDNPEIVAGIPFMPLAELYEWKKATARPKDIRDLPLIKAFLAQT